jgi:hypothetical protein
VNERREMDRAFIEVLVDPGAAFARSEPVEPDRHAVGRPKRFPEESVPSPGAMPKPVSQ